MQINKNINSFDSMIRILIAEIFLLTAYFLTGGIISIILYVLAIIMLITAIIGFCPLYIPLGINTCKWYSGTISKKYIILFIILYIIIAIGFAYLNNYFSIKIF
jgi:hypothetical protein